MKKTCFWSLIYSIVQKGHKGIANQVDGNYYFEAERLRLPFNRPEVCGWRVTTKFKNVLVKNYKNNFFRVLSQVIFPTSFPNWGHWCTQSVSCTPTQHFTILLQGSLSSWLKHATYSLASEGNIWIQEASFRYHFIWAGSVDRIQRTE